MGHQGRGKAKPGAHAGRIGLHRLRAVPGHQAYDGAGVDPAAEERADAYPDGIYFVSLAAVENEFLVLSIAAALLFSFFGRSAPQEQLVNYLRNKEMLLILDNLEQVMDATGGVNELLLVAPLLERVTRHRPD